MYLALFAASVAFVMTPVATPAPSSALGFGTLYLTRHDNAYDLHAARCAAMLIAPDTVLTAATCFDAMRVSGRSLSLDDFDATFALHSSEPVAQFAVTGFHLHPGFAVIDCAADVFENVCARATTLCKRRFTGLNRRVCLDDRAFYARTFVKSSSHNVAVAYLTRAVAATPIAVLASADAVLNPQQHITLWLSDGDMADTAALRRTPFDFMLPYQHNMRPGGFVVHEQPDTTFALVGVASHFAQLPYTAAVPLDYAFSRLDVVSDWLEGVTAVAYAEGMRLDPTSIRRVTPSRMVSRVQGPEPTPVLPSEAPFQHRPCTMPALQSQPEPPTSPVETVCSLSTNGGGAEKLGDAAQPTAQHTDKDTSALVKSGAAPQGCGGGGTAQVMALMLLVPGVKPRRFASRRRSRT